MGGSKKKTPGRKRTARKGQSKKTDPTARITDEEGEQMFALWCETRHTTGFSGVARTFGRALSSVRDYAKRNKWEDRYNRVREMVATRTNTDITQRHAEKLKLAGNLADAALGNLFEEGFGPDGRKRIVLKTDPSISDAIRAMKYEDELRAKFPEKADEHASALTEEQVSTALAMLEKLGPDGLEALGKFIAEKGKRDAEGEGEK